MQRLLSIHVPRHSPKTRHAARRLGTSTNSAASSLKAATQRGAPQIYVSFGDAMIIVRGQRPGRAREGQIEPRMGAPTISVSRVKGDFDGFCAGAKKRRAWHSSMEAHRNQSDHAHRVRRCARRAVSVELLSRKAQP